MVAVTLFSLSATAFQVKLQWTPSPDTNIVGYRVYCVYDCSTTNEMSCTNVVDVGNVSDAIVTELAPSTIYTFGVTAVDLAGDESEFSNWITYTTPVLLSLGTWPGIELPALVSTDLVNWSATDLCLVLTDRAPREFFRFAQPSMVLTNKQPQ